MSQPDAYKKGYIEFYKLRFKVTPDVLIPRPETELLVDEIINYHKLRTNYHEPITILDIGTGAGNIAISLANQIQLSTPGACLPAGRVEAQIIATDISPEALRIAKDNAKLHGVYDKIIFIESDLLEKITNHELKTANSKLIIVTNLPYIPSERIAYLDSSVKDYEPHIALNGGNDGFELYRKLFRQIKDHNINFGLLVGEIDYTHGELAIKESRHYFPNHESEVKTDLAHKQRILIIKSAVRN